MSHTYRHGPGRACWGAAAILLIGAILAEASKERVETDLRKTNFALRYTSAADAKGLHCWAVEYSAGGACDPAASPCCTTGVSTKKPVRITRVRLSPDKACMSTGTKDDIKITKKTLKSIKWISGDKSVPGQLSLKDGWVQLGLRWPKKGNTSATTFCVDLSALASSPCGTIDNFCGTGGCHVAAFTSTFKHAIETPGARTCKLVVTLSVNGVSCTGPTCGIDTLPEVKLEEVFRSLYEACKDGNPECFRDDGIGRSRTHDDATRSLVLPWFPDAESNPSLVSPGALYCNTPESKWFKPWTWWTDAYGDLAKGGTKRDAASIGSVQAPDQPVGATCVGSVRRTLDNNYVTGTHGSVVRLFIVKRNVKSGKLEVGVCTGTLVRRGRVLTAAHCFELAPGLRHHATIVVFGYTALPWDASGNHEKLSSLGKDGVRLAAVSENTGYAVAWPKDWYPIPMLDVAVVNIPGAPASVPISAAASFVTAGLGDSKSDPVPVKAYGAAGTAWCLSSCGGVASSAVAMQSSEATCVLAGSAKSKTGFLNFANLLSPVFGAMIYCPLSLFAGWSGGPLVKDDGLTSPVFGLNNYATLVDLTGFPSLGVPALTDCTNGGSPWRYGTPPLPTAGYNITSARFCYGEVSAGGATLLHGNQFAPIIDQDLVRQYPQLSQLAPDLCMTNDLISTMTCAGATGAGITCDNPYSYSEEASADGAVYTAVVDILASSGAPVSKLSFRWDMYTNPDRLQVYNYQTNGTRGALLLDTGFVGVQYNGCTRSDPINPAVTVVPSTNAASCASKDGCLGLTGYYRDTGACSVPTTQACVAEGFDAVSKVQVVVTSACAGSAWALEIKCG